MQWVKIISCCIIVFYTWHRWLCKSRGFFVVVGRTSANAIEIYDYPVTGKFRFSRVGFFVLDLIKGYWRAFI